MQTDDTFTVPKLQGPIEARHAQLLDEDDDFRDLRDHQDAAARAAVEYLLRGHERLAVLAGWQSIAYERGIRWRLA